MIKPKYNVVGVMSGTSLDGIDLIYVTFQLNGSWKFEILRTETINYSEEWYNTLKKLVSCTLDELKEIDKAYTAYLASIIKGFIEKNDINNIDAICSHGHTALHQPEKGLTYQIGNLPDIATIINNKVVCDFRIQDVALGGQGAPLVPIGDELLFPEYDYCINLGGFANISTKEKGQRIAYDICPVNIVLNYYVNTLGFDYDDGGKIAATGAINIQLLEQLNQLEFYNLSYPKSLGLEWVNTTIFPLINAYKIDVKNVLRTFVEHIAIQTGKAIWKKEENSSVFITGGGVYNTFLIERIKTLINVEIVLPSKAIIEFKEALIFGFLGVLKLRNEVNSLKSVTGAKSDHSSGEIIHPKIPKKHSKGY